MRNPWIILVLLAAAPTVFGDSLWLRRDPRFANLFQDFRARRVGDLLTIVVDETTEFEGLERRELEKKTQTSAGYRFNGKSSSDSVGRSFAAEFDGQGVSQRKFDGKNNSSIDRRLFDRMTVTVVAVLPNGNLVIEGTRRRMIQREVRTLLVRGVVRPADISAQNTVSSHFVAEFDVVYAGSGPESSYTNHGWWGRILNKLWPY